MPVVSNQGALASLSVLRGLNDELRDVNTRVSTGLKLNSPADGAAYWNIATVQTPSSSDEALDTLKAAQTQLQLGASLDPSSDLRASYTGFVQALVDANDRSIGALVDADLAEESTRLKALQTQQQLAARSLSISNSTDSILNLFT